MRITIFQSTNQYGSKWQVCSSLWLSASIFSADFLQVLSALLEFQIKSSLHAFWSSNYNSHNKFFCMPAWPQFSQFRWTTPKSAWRHTFIVSFHKTVVLCYSTSDSVVECCALKQSFLKHYWVLPLFVLLICHAVTHNYVLVVVP